MQFLRKLMNQTSKNDKKPNFGPAFGLFDHVVILHGLTQLWVPIFFFFLPALPLLDIKAIVYNNKQSLYVISRKSNEMTKNLVSGPILAPLA